MKPHAAFLTSAISALLLLSCSVDGISAPGNPGSASVSTEADSDISPATPEAILFAEKCAMCHRHNGMGTGLLARRMPEDQAMLENRTDLTSVLIQTAVRRGIGTMPPLSRAEVSDAQLREIERHLIIRHSAVNGVTP